MDLGPLFQKLPLTLGSYPTPFVDGALGPLFILGMPLSQDITLRYINCCGHYSMD
jgi:hypothetical protein